jgi:hypothetical protein
MVEDGERVKPCAVPRRRGANVTVAGKSFSALRKSLRLCPP